MVTDVNFDVQEITPTLGALIEGVKLSARLTSREVFTIRSLLLKYKVIFFEDQILTPEDQRDFTALFGELYIHPLYPRDSSVPEIVIFDNNLNNPTDNDSWHTDVSFAEKPVLGSVLYAKEIPPSGGDTLWSDMRAAYLALSEPLRRFLTGLEAIHDFCRGFAEDIVPSKNAGQKRYNEVRNMHPPVVHPVVRTHPETGEDCLFVNDGFTTRIIGLSDEESKNILFMLHVHIQRPEFTVRWRWKKNAVAFWDNRITQHYAVNDYLPHRRLMHRTTLVGDRPYHSQ